MRPNFVIRAEVWGNGNSPESSFHDETAVISKLLLYRTITFNWMAQMTYMLNWRAKAKIV